jgi:betaine-homocysteine S-methyltransferase
MELLPSIREQVSGYVAALPVPYHTTAEMPTFQSLRHPRHDGMLFPTMLEPFESTRLEVAEFARQADALGIQYLGLCCGNASYLTRSLAEALGRTPPASRYSPDMSKHAYFGSDPSLLEQNQAYSAKL